MLRTKRLRASFKIWLEAKGEPLLGKGGSEILEQVQINRSISKAARNLRMSYRYVWNYLQKIEERLGEKIVDTHRGGKSGGGGAELTELGKSLLSEYKHLESYLSDTIYGEKHWEVMKLKISARNRLKGKVVAVEKEGLMAKVKVEVTVPATVTAIISKEAAEDLGIKVGDTVETVIKATEVMIAK
jgi:molybdate transport system regulatory protein